MTLSDIAISRPVFTAMLALSFVVLGTLGFPGAGDRPLPGHVAAVRDDLDRLPGRQPGGRRAEITRPIEDAVAGINGVERVFSNSREDLSQVFVRFKMSVPKAEAIQQMRDKVGIAVAQLSSGARPRSSPSSTSTPSRWWSSRPRPRPTR
jgi:multidrug efflux pump subunit AcrB